ncbi:MAG: HAD family hydrolase [Clostridiales bacterium]|nr:HAD family hydrolase [Clostridiales bacterium]
MREDGDVPAGEVGQMIIFDLDGTLWDSSDVVAESWNMLIRKETGCERGLSGADIARNMGKTMNQIADDLFDDLEEDERYALARKCEVFENAYISEHGAVLYDKVRETLAELRERGAKLAVVSNCQEGYVKAFLDSMDMWDYFVDYEEWGRSGLLKADNIRLVMERNGEDKAIYVGDIQRDSDAAHEAGIPCIYAAYGFGDINDAEGRIDSFDELPARLEELGYL